jgi:hypothetical protein
MVEIEMIHAIVWCQGRAYILEKHEKHSDMGSGHGGRTCGHVLGW